MKNKVLIFSAPSGAGKSTIVNHLLKSFSNLEFSISATSRQLRGNEKDGVDYHFLSSQEFSTKVNNNEFIEWEEVYAGTCYGTLRSEVERIWAKGNIVVFDIDVVGGINVKKLFGDNAFSIFVQPPSVEELRKRLIGRATDSAEAIDKRILKAESELGYSNQFDVILINDVLEDALSEADKIIANFINK